MKTPNIRKIYTILHNAVNFNNFQFSVKKGEITKFYMFCMLFMSISVSKCHFYNQVCKMSLLHLSKLSHARSVFPGSFYNVGKVSITRNGFLFAQCTLKIYKSTGHHYHLSCKWCQCQWYFPSYKTKLFHSLIKTFYVNSCSSYFSS